MQDPQERVVYVLLRGGFGALEGANQVFLQTIEVVKVSMTVEVPVAEFDQAGFESNLATLLGIDPARIRVAGVNPVRRLSLWMRKLSDGGAAVDFEIAEDPPAPTAADITGLSGPLLMEAELSDTTPPPSPSDPFAPPTPAPTMPYNAAD